VTVPIASEIDGVGFAELRQIVDVRGAVLHMLRSDAADFDGFGECYFSEVVPGAVKAWKRHRIQIQQFAVPVGRVRLAIYDDRPASPTRGRLLVTELGRPDAYLRVRIPPSVWYGFACLGDGSALIANCADRPHDPSESDIRPFDDPAIPFSWA
jgi:dTDP-4-dehydrorhamnose 3,5-epimerase